jgi:hypothetical protein
MKDRKRETSSAESRRAAVVLARRKEVTGTDKLVQDGHVGAETQREERAGEAI